MSSISLKPTWELRRRLVAGLLGFAAWAGFPAIAQHAPSPPAVAQQPADHAPALVPPAQAKDAAAAPQNVQDLRARFAKERDAAIGAATERAKRKAGLFKQKRATLRAEADYNNSKLARTLAEIALEEYEESTFTADLAAIDGEIARAESNLIRAEERTARARRMYELGQAPFATKNSEELGLKKAQFTLEQAQAKRTVLVDYTKAKTIKELKSAVEKARSNELAKMQTWLREKAAASELERQPGPGNSR
jgi:hypothetical protein